MPSIIVRALDQNGDPVFGNNTQAFLTDINAVGQIILTSLKLFQGEWWEDQLRGTPYWQKILGFNGRNQQAVNNLITEQILNVPYVTDILNLQSSYNASTRSFSFSCVVVTKFGNLALSANTSIPTPPSGALQ